MRKGRPPYGDRPLPLDAGSVLPTPTPATHPHPALNWEALCCPPIVRRRPHLGYRPTVATRTSSATSPGSGGSGRTSKLASRLCRHRTRPRSDGAPAVVVERDGLGRRRGPRRRRRGSRVVPGAPRRPRHRRRGRSDDGALRRLPHRTRLPADQRPPRPTGAGVAVDRPAGPAGAQGPGPRRRSRCRPLGDDTGRTPRSLAPRVLTPSHRCDLRAVLPSSPSTVPQRPCGP
jgi:hypothetical protein